MARTFAAVNAALNVLPTVQHYALVRTNSDWINVALRTAITATTTTLAPVSEFTFTVEAGHEYQLQARLLLTGDATGGTKFDFAGGSATATGVNGNAILEIAAGSGLVVPITALNTSIGAAAAHLAGDFWLTFTATSTGTIALQFAQTAANASSILRAGSQLTVIDTTSVLAD